MSLMNGARRLTRAVCGIAFALVLASCGGGDQVDPFEPQRILSFGDETSALTADGHNYAVNGFNDDDEFDCTIYRNWVQRLADRFDLTFQECNPDGREVTGTLYAQPSAKVADVVGQIEQHLSNGTFGTRDLVTILVGANDVLEQYALYSSTNEEDLKKELGERGKTLAAQVNRIAQMGAKVLVVTVFNQGRTPFGREEDETKTDTDRDDLLGRLTKAFNDGMRGDLINDGTMIGLVLFDERLERLIDNEASFGLDNVEDPVCATAPPACTTETLVQDEGDGTGFDWLWADNLHLSSAGQFRLGDLAISRARNNPF